MINVVVRSGGRGVPQRIVQKEISSKEEKAKARGMLKGSLMKGDSNVNGLLDTLYDYSKPFYMMNNAIKKIEWVKKK